MKDFVMRFVLLAALFTVFGTMSLRAQSFEYDGLTYNVTGENEVEVTGYTTEPVNLVIPATVSYGGTDYGVTAVGWRAFYGSSNLVSIEFPDFIKSIGSYAFANCIGLTSVSLPEGLTEMTMGTFIGCTGLVSVSFPSSLKSFGTGTFEGCTGLTSLSLPENLTDTGWGAFRDCTGLVSVDFPSGLTNIGRETFWGCTNLPSVDLPENLASIGDDAFYTCSSLASIDLPASLSSFGAGVFSGCTGLTSINVDAGNSFYCSQDGILFTKDMTELICYPAAKEGEHYAVPSGVVIICDEAFDSSYNLTSVDLPEGLTSIGAGAFSGCSLISIDLPESLVSIGASAFYGKNWTSLVLPENLRSVGYGAFSWSDALVSVAILSDTLEIDGGAFSGCGSIKEILVLGDTYPTVVNDPLWGEENVLFDGLKYLLYSFSGETLPEFWSAPAATVKLSLGGLSDKMPYTGKFPDLYIDGNASSYEMTVDESSMTFDTAPGTHTLDSFGFWLYKDGYEGDKTLVTINQPVTYTIEGAGIDDAAASGIGCYPGVADDMLTVSGTVAGASLRVIDLSGAQRMSVACTDGETAVDVSSLAQGMYFVLVEDGGDVAARLRFVKK